METQNILKELREKHGLTQEQLAERVMVTRQAVSRWETGETQPNTETLKLLSREYGVSINIVLASVEVLEGAPLGGMVAILKGDEKQLAEALGYLNAHHVEVEVLRRG